MGNALAVAVDLGEAAGIIAQQFLLDQGAAQVEVESFMQIVVGVEQLALGQFVRGLPLPAAGRTFRILLLSHRQQLLHLKHGFALDLHLLKFTCQGKLAILDNVVFGLQGPSQILGEEGVEYRVAMLEAAHEHEIALDVMEELVTVRQAYHIHRNRASSLN